MPAESVRSIGFCQPVVPDCEPAQQGAGHDDSSPRMCRVAIQLLHSYDGPMDTPAGPHVLRAGEGDVTGEPGLLDRYLLESAASSGRVALV